MCWKGDGKERAGARLLEAFLAAQRSGFAGILAEDISLRMPDAADSSYMTGTADSGYMPGTADSSYIQGTADESYMPGTADGGYMSGAADSSYTPGTADGRHIQDTIEKMAASGEWITARTEKGKPYWVHHPEIQFSVTDSGTVKAAAFAAAPVGLDVQVRRRKGVPEKSDEDSGRLLRIARRSFHHDEIHWITDDRRLLRERFYTIWTAKEAYVKYTGQGIDNMFSRISVMPEQAGQLEAGTWHALGCRFDSFFPSEDCTGCLCMASGTQTAADVTEEGNLNE